MSDKAESESRSESQKVRLEIRKGADAELRLGGLRFVACRREIDTIDGGITLIVWGDPPDASSDGQELLRFDFFRNRPHYHSPASNQAETAIDSEKYGDGQTWGIEQLTRSAHPLVVAAGFEKVASSIDRAALARGSKAIESLFADLGEPNEISHFEVDAKAVAALR